MGERQPESVGPMKGPSEGCVRGAVEILVSRAVTKSYLVPVNRFLTQGFIWDHS